MSVFWFFLIWWIISTFSISVLCKEDWKDIDCLVMNAILSCAVAPILGLFTMFIVDINCHLDKEVELATFQIYEKQDNSNTHFFIEGNRNINIEKLFGASLLDYKNSEVKKYRNEYSWGFIEMPDTNGYKLFTPKIEKPISVKEVEANNP